MKRHTILREICFEKKEEENMNRGKNLIQLVLVGILSLMLVSCGTPPTRDNGDSSLVSDGSSLSSGALTEATISPEAIDNTRATDWAWIDAGGRATPSYLSGHGVKGSPYILWVRRNAAESAYSTAISGSWSPDEY